MNEQKFFELTDGFRPEYIAEAAAWKHEQKSAETEIGAIFDAEIQRRRPELQTEKEVPSTEAKTDEPVETVMPEPETQQALMLRRLAFGITAIAAALALTVGVLVYTAQRTGDSPVSQAGTAPADSSMLSVQTGMEPGIALQTQTAVNGESASETTASGTESAADAPVSDPDAAAESFTGENFLGGTGHLRVISEGKPELVFDNGTVQTFGTDNLMGSFALEDDEYWYLRMGSMQSRISKTQRDENGKANNEYICQKQGCPHRSGSDCPAAIADHLITDGYSLFSYDQNMLFRIDDTGRKTPFFRLKANAEGKRYMDHIQSINGELITVSDTVVYASMELVFFGRLGDTGKWYAEFEIVHYDNSYDFVNVVFEPMNDKGEAEVTYLQLPDDSVDSRIAYDNENELLYLGVYADKRNDNSYYGYDLCAFDINTGEMRWRSDTHPTQSFWCYHGGRIYTFNPETEEMLSGGKVYGGRLLNNYGYFDCETGEWTTVEERSNLQNVRCIGDKIYARRERSVGDDTIICMNPDGTDEEVLYTRKNRITSLNYVSPDFMFVQTSGGFELIVNGECIPLNYNFDF